MVSFGFIEKEEIKLIEQPENKIPKRRGSWRPGQSGNPAGRPKGIGAVARLRASISEHVPGIITGLVNAAKAGDVQAARVLIERVIPPMKSTELAVPLALPDGSLTEQGRAVLAAVSVGDLAPGQGAQLLAAIGALARVAEIDELTERIAKLEEAQRNE